METRDFVQLAMLAMDGEIQGKTKLQKTVYFLGLMTNQLNVLGYRAHYYGPYSDEVAAALGWLKTIGAIDQSSSGVGSTDPHGFEIRRHDFRLNERGRKFAEATAGRHQSLMSKLRNAATQLKAAGDPDYIKMSIAAKTFFMLRETNGKAREEDLASLASNFGWEVTPDQIRDAASYLGRLGLVHVVSE